MIAIGRVVIPVYLTLCAGDKNNITHNLIFWHIDGDDKYNKKFSYQIENLNEKLLLDIVKIF